MHAGLIGVLALVALAGLPGESAAALVPPEATQHGLEARRLAEIRERLERRRALQRSLQVRVDGLAAEIEDLRVQLEGASAMLQSERQKATLLERRLDQLVPRLLARMAGVRQRREQAARALASLAAKGRSVRHDPTVHARMLALSPLMLERVRQAETGLGMLRERRDRTIERHAEIEHRLPALANARQRLQRLRAETVRLQQGALDRLRELHVEVRLLGEEQTQLASRLLRDEVASMARADPQPDRRALPNSSAMRAMPFPSALPFPPASVDKATVDARARLTHVADARSRAGSRVVAEALDSPGALDPPPELAANAGALTTSLARARLHAALRGESLAGKAGGAEAWFSRVSALDAVFQPEAGPSEPAGARARVEGGGAPLLPLAEVMQAPAFAQGGPEVSIAAAPGQGVAAPVDGKVVFAGTFKSYGWLLILEHEREYHTLLWGFARLDVERGDQVRVGQIVGIMGARGDDPPVLHVERRRNGRPIDLAASSNGIQG